MPLKVELAPFEQVYLGRELIRNGPQRWKFEVESPNIEMVRGRDILTAAEADTPAKRLYAAIFEGFLADEPVDRDFVRLAKEVKISNPAAQQLLADSFLHLVKGSFTLALRPLKKLIKLEAEELAAEGTGGPELFQHDPSPPEYYVPSRHEIRRQAKLQANELLRQG